MLMRKVLVLALGNDIRKDDAAAFRAAEVLSVEFSGDERVAVVKTLRSGIALIDYFLEDYDRIYVLDTVVGERHGEVRTVSLESYRPTPSPPHFMGLPEVLELARALRGSAPDIKVYCIEVSADSVGFGVGLSPEAEEAARRLAEIVRGDILRFLAED